MRPFQPLKFGLYLLILLVASTGRYLQDTSTQNSQNVQVINRLYEQFNDREVASLNMLFTNGMCGENLFPALQDLRIDCDDRLTVDMISSIHYDIFEVRQIVENTITVGLWEIRAKDGREPLMKQLYCTLYFEQGKVMSASSYYVDTDLRSE